METDLKELKKSYEFAKIIGIAMVASIFVYALVIEVINRQYAPFEGFSPIDEIDMLRYLLLAVAFIEFFLIGHINNLILSGKFQINANTSRQNPASSNIQKLTSSAIISYALCESVAIYGLILFLTNGDRKDFYAFFILSIICFGKYFPRYARWEEYVKQKKII